MHDEGLVLDLGENRTISAVRHDTKTGVITSVNVQSVADRGVHNTVRLTPNVGSNSCHHMSLACELAEIDSRIADLAERRRLIGDVVVSAKALALYGYTRRQVLDIARQAVGGAA